MDQSISAYHPHGDGIHSDTAILNSAIERCAASGGGVVMVDAGTYLCGTLYLKSNVILHLKRGAVILLSDNEKEFFSESFSRDEQIHRPTWENCDYDGRPSKYFITAKNISHFGIEGEGVIDGHEELFYGKVTPWHIEGAYYPRIPLVHLEGCSDFYIKDVTLRKSAFWTTHLVGCRNVLIEHLTIENNLRFANCDGIDPDHCQNVKIKNCHIECADDCIVLKTTKYFKHYGPCENIIVEDCHLVSTSAAIKVGSESVSDFRKVRVKNCRIERSNRGISLMLRDGGSVEDLTFENLSIETRRFAPLPWWGKGEPIAITAVARNSSTTIGTIRNIVFKNISCQSENGIFLYAETLGKIENVRLEDVSVKLENRTSWEKGIYDIRPVEEGGIFNKGIYGAWLYRLQGIVFCNFVCDAPILKEETED